MKIAILGSAPTSVMLAPFGQEGWEIWACSMANAGIDQVDVWFDPHCYDETLRRASGEKEWLAYLDRQKKVYMQKKDRDVRNSVAIPFHKLRLEFGDFFWGSSVSYMLAMAILEKPTHLAVYGVDMCHHTEYGHQRMGCQFFLHEAWRRGIKVIVPPEAEIGQAFPPYGYSMASRAWRRLEAKRKELEGKRNALQNQMAALQRDMHNLDGALTQISSDQIYVCDADQFSTPETDAPEIEAPEISAPQAIGPPLPSIRIPADWKVTNALGATVTALGATVTKTKASTRKGKGNGASRQSPD